jgi:hypothetical protein
MFEFFNEIIFGKNTNCNELLVQSDSLNEFSQENCALVCNFENNARIMEYMDDDLENIVEGEIKDSRIRLSLLINPNKDNPEKPSYFKLKQILFDRKVSSFKTYKGEEAFIIENINEPLKSPNGRLILTYEKEQTTKQVSLNFKVNQNPPKHSNMIVKRKHDKILFSVLYEDNCYYLTKFVYYPKKM